MLSFTSLPASFAQGNGPSLSSIIILILGLLVAMVNPRHHCSSAAHSVSYLAGTGRAARRLCPRASSVHFEPGHCVPAVSPTVALLIRMADLVARFSCQSAPYLAAGSRSRPGDHRRGGRRGAWAHSRASLGSRLRARRHRLTNRRGGRDCHFPATRHPPTAPAH